MVKRASSLMFRSNPGEKSGSSSASSLATKTKSPGNENATFTPFSRLPTEISTQIWTLSLPPPRLIELQTEHGTLTFPTTSQKPQKFTHVWTPSTYPVPSLLHTTHHSRIIALEHYTLSFDHNPRPPASTLLSAANTEGLIPLRRGRSRAIPENDEDLFDFPYKEAALVYVDLKRDIFITSHRRLHRRSKPMPSAPHLANLPVLETCFKLSIFRSCIPREVFEQIHTFVATFALGMHELFPGRFGMGMGTNTPVFLIRDAFLREGEGEDHDEESFGKGCGRDFINTFKGSWSGISEERREKLGKRIVGPLGWKEFNAAFESGELF